MDRRERYLRAALELFSTHGFVGTTTDMIVARTGGSKATLYKHFPSKEALVAGVMEQLVGRASEAAPGLDEALPCPEALDRFGRTLLGAIASPEAVALVRLSLGEYARFPEVARLVWERGPAVTYTRFRRFLAAREASGELVVPDHQLAAEQFISGLVGHAQLKVAFGQGEPPDEEEIAVRVASSVQTFMARYGAPAVGG